MKRVGVVAWFPENAAQEWREVVRAVHASLERLGNIRVELFLAPSEGGRKLTGMDILVVGYPVESWFPKTLDPRWMEFLSRCGHIVGKKTVAFTGTRTWGSEKTLVLLMNALEREGAVVKDFSLVSSPKAAPSIASKVKLTV